MRTGRWTVVGTVAVLITFFFTAFPCLAVDPALFADVSVRNQAGAVTLPARLWIPRTVGGAPQAGRPLVIFFHGGAESGTNNTAQVESNIDFLYTQCQTRNAYLLAPQFGVLNNNNDDIYISRVIPLCESLIRDYNIDPNRIYVTGFSLGGRLTQRLMTAYSERIAAAIPICPPAAIGANFNNIAGKPVWIFHARNDSIIYVGYGRGLFNTCLIVDGIPTVQSWPTNADPDITFTLANSPVVYTEYQTGDHWIWYRVYLTTEVMDWFFSQSLPVSACDSLDFNHDGNIDPIDVDAYFSVLGQGPCLGSDLCSDLDFNNDGDINPLDVDAYFSVLGQGPCLQ